MPTGFDLHKFSIELDGAGRGTIEMDGRPVKGVKRVSFDGAAGEISTVTLTIHAEIVSKVEAA